MQNYEMELGWGAAMSRSSWGLPLDLDELSMGSSPEGGVESVFFHSVASRHAISGMSSRVRAALALSLGLSAYAGSDI